MKSRDKLEISGRYWTSVPVGPQRKCETRLRPGWPRQRHTLSLLLNFATRANNGVILLNATPGWSSVWSGSNIVLGCFWKRQSCAFLLSLLTSAVNDCVKMYIFLQLSPPLSIKRAPRISEDPSIEPLRRLCRGALSCGTGQTETVTLDYTLLPSCLDVERVTLMSLRHNQTRLEAFVCFMFSFFTLHLRLCCFTVARANVLT